MSHFFVNPLALEYTLLIQALTIVCKLVSLMDYMLILDQAINACLDAIKLSHIPLEMTQPKDVFLFAQPPVPIPMLILLPNLVFIIALLDFI
jgi:hypothetical protein